MPDTPDAVTTAMVREQRDLLDAQPMHLTFVADDLANGETYLVDLDNHGAVLVKRIGFTQNEHMAFSPGAFMAIAEATAAWNLAIHEWKQHQAFVKAQKAAEEATRPWTKADLPSPEGLPAVFDGPTQDQEPTIEQQRDASMDRFFLDGVLSQPEYERLKQQVKEDPRLGICQECLKLCTPGYLYHSECFHKPGVVIGGEPEEQVVDLPAGEPAFQDENGLPIPF